MGSNELSLIARYDDLLRTQHPFLVLNEKDWISFIRNELKIRQDIRNNTEETDRLRRELKQETNERKRLELILTQVRRELEEEMVERKRAQDEADQLVKQMQVIKEIVGSKNNTSYNMLSEEDRQRLAFLNASHGSPSMMDTALMGDSLSLLSDSEYDKTGDDLLTSRHRRRSKRKSSQRRSNPPPPLMRENTLTKYSKMPTAPPESEETDNSSSLKRRRMLAGAQTTSDETDDSLLPPRHEAPVKLRRSGRNKMRRSLSVGDPIDKDDQADSDSFFDIETGRRIPLSNGTPRSILKKSTASAVIDSPPVSQSPPESPTIKRWASASKLHRAHNLFQKNVVKPETCSPCGKKIKFGKQAFKCKECKLASHIECRDRMSQVCIPADTTPTKGSQGNMITDYSPANPPYIPAMILQCVNEVERRGLSVQGIYRETGSLKEIRELKEKFLKGKDVRLEHITDIHVICGCLKDFLRSLKEPLIPTSLWSSFVSAAKIQEDSLRHNSIRGATKLLPPTNRDCLSFIVMHLQRVAERPETRMSTDNLARVFGPTIVGYSVAQPEPSQMISETRPQQLVITALMELDADYWEEVLAGGNSEVTSMEYDITQTPEQTHHHHHAHRETGTKSTAKVKQFFGESPRFPSTPAANKSFFPSPMLK